MKEFHCVSELLKLLFSSSQKNPQLFVSLFHCSNSMIGFNYNCLSRKITHLSQSFYEILGFNSQNLMTNQDFSEKIIHPHDKVLFDQYLRVDTSLDKLRPGKEIKNVKCRARHIKGYWKNLVFLTLDYLNKDSKVLNKAGIIIDQHIDTDLLVFFNAPRTGRKKVKESNTIEMTGNSRHVKISPRETEILELISVGKIAKEIAEDLNISTNTVISHRKNLIKKMAVKNTAELIKTASQLLLV